MSAKLGFVHGRKTGRRGLVQRPRAKLELRGQGRAQAGAWARAGVSFYGVSLPDRAVDGRKHLATFRLMKSAGFIYWQDDGWWLGTLDEFPDYTTQGTSFEDLKDHLQDLHKELSSGSIPGVRRHAELEVA